MSKMHNPAHPGEVLREFIPEGMSVTRHALPLVERPLSHVRRHGHPYRTADPDIAGILARQSGAVGFVAMQPQAEAQGQSATACGLGRVLNCFPDFQ